MTIYPNDWEPECGAIFDGKYDVDIEDQFRILLILAYVQLSVPVLTLISSCIQARMEVSFFSSILLELKIIYRAQNTVFPQTFSG